MSKTSWEVRSLKHWPDGSWDAFVTLRQEGVKMTKRIVSEDGFKWVTNYNAKVPEEIQEELTKCMGDMLDQNIGLVLF